LNCKNERFFIYKIEGISGPASEQHKNIIKNMKKKSGASSTKSNGGGGGHSLDDLLERGASLLEANQPELAKPFLERAIQISPSSTEALDLIGECYVDLGEYDDAKRAFERSVQIAPEESGTKWMFLGQLATGEQALKLYQRGCELLEKQKADPLRTKQLCKAKVAIAELYLTDLCMEDKAEANCERTISEAEALDPSSIEVAQTKASMRLSQCRPEEARTCILRVADVLLSTPYDDREVPFEFCVQTCRLLVELAETDRAVRILEALLKEDDENIEVWILLGHCHIENDKQITAECWERAEEILQDFLHADPSDELFRAQLAHVQELQRQIENDS
jgi:tetratricopeptide (TPR) repeat protein